MATKCVALVFSRHEQANMAVIFSDWDMAKKSFGMLWHSLSPAILCGRRMPLFRLAKALHGDEIRPLRVEGIDFLICMSNEHIRQCMFLHDA